MDSTETTMARELFHQIMQTKRSLHAGMTDILADAPAATLTCCTGCTAPSSTAGGRERCRCPS